MNVLIDNRWKKSGGIGTFAEEVNNILKYPNAGFKGTPFSGVDTLRTSFRMLLSDRKVYFFPGYIPPIYSKSKFVFTIHDLNHIDRKENSSVIKRFFYNTIIMRGCKKASFIFTVSEFSRRRIIEWSKVDESKVINVGNGVSNRFCIDGVKKDYGFEYILCVGNRKAHKNETRILEAFSRANVSDNLKIVFTGSLNDTLDQKIHELGLSERVIFTGYIKTADLPPLYRGAKALVFVSLYEGFGLPVIEAMACGTPVVTSNTTSLGEVAGEAAILVNPESTTEITSGIEQVINDNDKRAWLISNGLKRAQLYTWDKVANKISDVLSSLD